MVGTLLANDAVKALVAKDAVPVNAPTNDPEKDPVAMTVVVVLVPSNASIIFVTCVDCIVPPPVIPVLLIVPIYALISFFIY